MAFRHILWAAVVLAISQSPVLAASCKPADKSLSGRYQLTGVRETGSGIALSPDGRFGYFLSVGAFDEIARGCWRATNTKVILTPSLIKANSGEPTFKTLKLKREKGGLVRFYKGKRYGIYKRIK